MFSTLPPTSHHAFQSTHYAPVTPSPLSSSPLRASPNRDDIFSFDMASLTPPQTNQTERSSESAYSARQTKKNPLIHRNDNDNGRETRRKLFLRRVRQDSEDKRWEKRGGDDEIMRTIWIAEQKRRDERRARDAQAWAGIEEEEEDLDEAQLAEIGNVNPSKDEEMVDEVAQQEDAEMEAMLSMLDAESWDPPPSQRNRQDDNNTTYGSDDDEYDQLFMEIGFDETGGNLSSPPVQSAQEPDQDMMDMS
ncbi:hypothetical protein V496_03629 [Pseudogymnoascus sp. VKM F-4515 (FW-2607)]|nr:hypothetical protein V496_03629 [Pseudogymnoascus sp. VKM F-4515 (FW-2607)]KFY95588.1 hypothetical protein V498_03267 [Pseudogymnoascus sp. VKM F-4517 (FW-2822)]